MNPSDIVETNGTPSDEEAASPGDNPERVVAEPSHLESVALTSPADVGDGEEPSSAAQPHDVATTSESADLSPSEEIVPVTDAAPTTTAPTINETFEHDAAEIVAAVTPEAPPDEEPIVELVSDLVRPDTGDGLAPDISVEDLEAAAPIASAEPEAEPADEAGTIDAEPESPAEPIVAAMTVEAAGVEPTIESAEASEPAPTLQMANLAPADAESAAEPVTEAASIDEMPTAAFIPEPLDLPKAAAAAEGDAAAEEEAAEAAGTPGGLARIAERSLVLAGEIGSAPNKAHFVGRVRRLLDQAAKETGEGVDAVLEQLRGLEQEIQEQIDQRANAKEAIIARAEEVKESTEWKVTGDALRSLFEQWRTIGSAGRELDDALWARFTAAREVFNQRRAKHFEERQQVWAENRTKKEALCVRAEELATSTDWRATSDAMRALQAEWKQSGSAGREGDEELWTRFRAAQDAFFDARALFWGDNRKKKEALIAQAEALDAAGEWSSTFEQIKTLQASWKDVGPIGHRDAEDELWRRFRGATQPFFERRQGPGPVAAPAERHFDDGENLRRKEELVNAAEALSRSNDPVAATEEAKELQAEWKAIGPVRRDRGDALWGRFRAACDRIFENAAVERTRRQTTWNQKLRDALERKEEQLTNLQAAIAHDESTIARWQTMLANAAPGGNAETRGLEARLADITDRLRGKRERLTELEASVEDIRSKVR